MTEHTPTEQLHEALFATDVDVTIPSRPPNATKRTPPPPRARAPWRPHQIILAVILTLVAGIGLGMLAVAATAPAERPQFRGAAFEQPVTHKATTVGIRQADPATGLITGTPLHEFALATYQEAIGPIQLCGYAADSAYLGWNGTITFTFYRAAQLCGYGGFAMNQNVHAELWFMWTDGVWYKHPNCSTIGAVGGYSGSFTWSRQCAIWGHVPVALHYNVQLWTYSGSPVLTEWDHWSLVGFI